MSSPVRKINGQPVLRYQFDQFDLFPVQRALWRSGVRVPLTPKPADTLLLLVEHAGETVPKEDLMAAVWNGAAVEENNLTQSISALRKALGEKRGENRFIATDPGRGYRFVASVERVTSAPTGDRADGRPQKAMAYPTSSSRWFAAAGVLALLIATASWLTVRHSAPPSPMRQSVAVLEIRNLSQTSAERWFETALAEMLASELAAGGALRAIPAEEVTRWRADLGRAAQAPRPGDLLHSAQRNLGADTVVTGTYFVTGTCPECRVRVDLGLMNARSGERIGTVIEDGSADDLIDLTSRLGRRLRAELGVPAEIAASPRWPASSAMRDYAEGLQALRQGDPLAARDRLVAAAAADPGNALIHSALSDTWTALGYGTRAIEEGRQAYELSASLDRLDQLGIEARYRAGAQQWDRAIEAYRAIFQLFPDSLEDGLNLARAQFRGQRTADLKITLRALRRLPPPRGNDPRIDLIEARAVGVANNYPLTRDLAHRAAEEAHARGARYLYARARLLEGGAMQNLQDPRYTAVQDEARQVCEQIGDRDCVSQAWRIRGNERYYFGDFQHAGEAYTRGVAIARELGNRAELANLLAGFGVVAQADRDWSRAESDFREAIALRIETGYTPSASQALLAELFLVMGRTDDAAKLISAAREAAGRAGAQEDLGELFRLSARLAERTGDLGLARRLIDQALKELRSAQSRMLTALALAESGSLATTMGDLARAGRDLAEAGPDLAPESEGAARLALAELATAQGRFADSVTEARRAAISLDKAHADTPSARAFLAAADALEMQNQTAEALAACRESEIRAARVPDPVPLALARLCEWRLSPPAPPAPTRPALVAQAVSPAHQDSFTASRDPAPDLANPEVALAHAYARAMRARRIGARDARVLFEALARSAEPRGYLTLARRAAALAQTVK